MKLVLQHPILFKLYYLLHVRQKKLSISYFNFKLKFEKLLKQP